MPACAQYLDRDPRPGKLPPPPRQPEPKAAMPVKAGLGLVNLNPGAPNKRPGTRVPIASSALGCDSKDGERRLLTIWCHKRASDPRDAQG